MLLHFKRLISLTVFLVGVAQAFGSSDVVPLPQVDVTDSRILPPPEKWRYVAVGDFEILSNASNRETTRFVGKFLRLQEAMRIAWPVLASVKPAVPTCLLLCKSGDTLQTLLAGQDRNSVNEVNSVFLRGIDRTFIAVDFTPSQVERDSDENSDTIDVNSTTSTYYDPYREVYRQYFHLLLRNSGKTPPPLWLEEGLAQLLAGLDFNEKYLVFGRIGEHPGEFNRALEQQGFMPFGQMFAADRPPPNYERIWAAQCNAFVHLGLFGMRQKYRAGFIRFASLACRQPVTEDMFKTCFGSSYKDMQLGLRGYVQHTAHGYFEKSGPDYARALAAAPAFSVREATQGESGRIKGEALAAAGKSIEARDAFSAAYARDPGDAELAGAIGLFERRSGTAEHARVLLEAAVKAKVPRPSVYLELARLNFDLAQSKPASNGNQFSASQVSAVLTPLFAARELHLVSPELYELIADTWMRSATPPRTDNLTVLDEGIREYPNRPTLVYATARLYWQSGDKAVVEQLIQLGTKLAANDREMTAKFETLRDTVNAVAPAPTPERRITTPADGQ